MILQKKLKLKKHPIYVLQTVMFLKKHQKCDGGQH